MVTRMRPSITFIRTLRIAFSNRTQQQVLHNVLKLSLHVYHSLQRLCCSTFIFHSSRADRVRSAFHIHKIRGPILQLRRVVSEVGRDSSVNIATRYGWTVPGSNAGRDKIFLTRPERPWGPQWLPGLFPGGKTVTA